MAFLKNAGNGCLIVCKCEMEFTNIELVTFFNAFGIDAMALELNAVGGIEVFDVISAILIDDGTVFSRNIAIPNDEIREL